MTPAGLALLGWCAESARPGKLFTWLDDALQELAFAPAPSKDDDLVDLLVSVSQRAVEFSGDPVRHVAWLVHLDRTLLEVDLPADGGAAGRPLHDAMVSAWWQWILDRLVVAADTCGWWPEDGRVWPLISDRKAAR